MNRPNSITTTFHRSYNYGATLQAYALQQSLLKIGFDNKILDFTRNPYEKLPLFSGKIKKDLARLMLRFIALFHAKEKKRLVNAFDRFTDKYLRLTSKYDDLNKLNEDELSADCFFTGSDQILTLRESELVVNRNLLCFVKKARKYSYAASLADYDLNNEEKNKLSYCLNDFEIVSLREKEAQDYLTSFVNIQFRVDVDPVFLIDAASWCSLAIQPNFKEDYILYFQVNSNPRAQVVVDAVKNRYKCPVVCLQTNPMVRIKADKVVLDASPEEFIGWIQNAKIVITTSFHGTAFSILLHKEFFTLTKAKSNPVRISNLLRQVHLEERMIDCAEKINSVEAIDWDTTDMLVGQCKKNSMDYLQSVYNAVKKQKR